MTTPRSSVAKSKNEKGLERKLSAYTVASGAFLATSATGSAQAGIVYSGPLDITIAPGGNAALSIGNVDNYVFSNFDYGYGNTPSGSTTLRVATNSANAVCYVDFSTNTALALAAGAKIPPPRPRTGLVSRHGYGEFGRHSELW